jgi:formylmethanofuran dehydrogenase subunit E
MERKETIVPVDQRCDLCERLMNPTVNIYKDDYRLCNACYYQMGQMPLVVVKCVERFLVGNVV